MEIEKKKDFIKKERRKERMKERNLLKINEKGIDGDR